MRRTCTTIALAALVFAAPAAAQTGPSTVALGGNVNFKNAAEPESSGKTTLGILWRLGKGHDGWGPAWGLNWYQADLETTIGGARMSFGEAKVRPFMAGYGYSATIGRVRASANMLAGFALTSFDLAPEAVNAYSQQLSAPSLRTRISNPLVLRPEIGLWMNTTRRIGVNVTLGYMIAHPTVFIESPTNSIERHINANMFTVSIGAAYSLF